MKMVSAAEAVSHISSGSRVVIHGSAATPLALTKALGDRAAELRKVEIVSLTTLGEMNLLSDRYPDSFYVNSLFVSSNTRAAVNDERGDYIPIFISEISQLFSEQNLPVDFALVHVSPPDVHGFCSLGVSVDIIKSAVNSAKTVIAQVNPKMPRTLVMVLFTSTALIC